LKKDPDNAEAYAGLALAHAWLGDTDTALVFCDRSLALRPEDEMEELRATLMKKRRPQVEGDVSYWSRRGRTFGLKKFATAGGLELDPSPFTTVHLWVGSADYWHGGRRADDTVIKAGGQYRWRGANRTDLDLGRHSLGPDGRNWEMAARYSHDAGDLSGGLGFKREFVEDSFLAVKGQNFGGVSYGAARSNLLYAEGGRVGDGLTGWLRAYGGWVSAQSLSDNNFAGLNFGVTVPLLKKQGRTLSAGYKLDASHYEEDQSGLGLSAVEPLPGGYFSPDVFVNQTPQLILKLTGAGQTFDVEAGPSLQYVEDASVTGKFRLGLEAGARYRLQITRNVAAALSAHALRISDVYTQVGLDGSLSYRF
jgi:hypothetical protein